MNKTILITGSSSGIGRTAALLFAEMGWNEPPNDEYVAFMRSPFSSNPPARM